MLLVHGSIDDNVHQQNSEQFAYELQRAGKPFEMMMYPRSRHGITDPRLNLHLRQVMFDFVMRDGRSDARQPYLRAHRGNQCLAAYRPSVGVTA